MPEEDAWAEDLGGRILPEARGPLSAEWRALLAEESPGVQGGARSGAGRAPRERLLQPAMYGALMENAHNGGVFNNPAATGAHSHTRLQPGVVGR